VCQRAQISAGGIKIQKDFRNERIQDAPATASGGNLPVRFHPAWRLDRDSTIAIIYYFAQLKTNFFSSGINGISLE